MFAAFLKDGGVAIADQLHLNRARALERYDRNYKISDIKELTIDGQATETWLRKNGLLYSIDGRYELSPIANAIIKEKITLADYCFLLLSKQWIKIKEPGGKDEYKTNLLSVILADFISCLSIPIGDFVSHVGQIALDKYKDEYFGLALSNQEAARFLVEPLLISKLIIEKDDKYSLNPDMQDLVADYVNNSKQIKKINQVACADEEYWNSFQYGFYDIVNNENKHLYVRHYPQLFAMKELYKENGSLPLQQIYYGAPGTGKSHKIKDDKSVKEADKKNMVFRTTFHPDSDYSTFVGAYKPTMKSSERIYSPEELTIKLKEIKTTGTTYPCHKFAAKYWESLKDLTPDSIKQILNACGFTDNYSVEIGKGVAIGQEYLNNPEDGKIIYSFCPQAFTNAYVEAWNTEEEVYLVIEEINRGNCAQIFGDLFQLLDRKNGISEYPVEADTDLQNYLCKALADTKRADIPDDVRSGKKLMLPSNLYIWATMNTSDQSLFPIDSAFKRRWEWKYIKIKEGKDENGNKLDWKVDVKMDEAGTLLPWWDFIKKINEIIASMTSSADKQLGYFFCCAKDGVIDEETFVSKVIFYLWNDVFKDYGFEDASLFRYTTKDEDGKDVEKDLTFPDFYDEEGEKVNTERLTDFVKKVMSWKKTNAEQD